MLQDNLSEESSEVQHTTPEYFAQIEDAFRVVGVELPCNVNIIQEYCLPSIPDKSQYNELNVNLKHFIKAEMKGDIEAMFDSVRRMANNLRFMNEIVTDYLM